MGLTTTRYKPVPATGAGLEHQGSDHNHRISQGFLADTVMAIGSDLDRGMFPRVLDRGIVTPGAPSVAYPPGKEQKHVGLSSQEPFPSPPRSAPPGASQAPWPAGSAAPIERSGLANLCEAQLTECLAAYPGTRIWREREGMWLLVPSAVVDGSGRAATFLLALNWQLSQARGWGYWLDSVATVRWIGPRHTNFPDGSVCAFEPLDQTWRMGESMTALLDLYTVWAFRHLHLELFGRWPGPQSVRHPFERRTEFRANELCGCGSSSVYRDCCFTCDAQRDVLSDVVNFVSHHHGGVREPPRRLAQVALGTAEPPLITSVFSN
jgi:hypothetical protein